MKTQTKQQTTNTGWTTKTPFIADKILYSRWAAINKHLSIVPHLQVFTGLLKICSEGGFYIAKNKTKFRPIGVLDWAHYTPAGLATAIETQSLETYYQAQLLDAKSDPNVWSDPVVEAQLKDYYLKRAGK